MSLLMYFCFKVQDASTILTTAKQLLATMAGHVLMDSMPTTVPAIQVFTVITVIATSTSVRRNLAETGELVQMVLPSIIVNVSLVSQVCLLYFLDSFEEDKTYTS